MKNTKINDLWFYKYRYQIGYTGLFISYLLIIFYSIFIAPRGLTINEMNSAYESSQLSLNNLFSLDIINAPYKLLQAASISILGVSLLSVKLPSVILSLFALFGIIKLTNKWFSPGIATLASVIALTSSQFFFLAQNGSPEILYVLYPILILFFGASFISSKNKIPNILIFAILLGLSLYTPLGIYVVLAMILTILAHPHLRFMIKKLQKSRSVIGFIVFVLIISPLAIAIFKDFSIVKLLLGIPETLDVFANIQNLISHLFGFSVEYSGGVISPIINLTSLILIGIGLFFTLSARYATRSYLINIWSIILIAVCIISPNSTTIIFTPILILTISGLQSLINTWYIMFPRNPYARIAGLFPIVILVVSLLLTNFDSFRLNYTYSPEILSNFSQDIEILQSSNLDTRNMIVSKDEENFYKILETEDKVNLSQGITGDQVIVSNKAYKEIDEIPENYKVIKILISSRDDDADRFYILKRS